MLTQEIGKAGRCRLLDIEDIQNIYSSPDTIFFSFGATVPIWALVYLHEILHFTSVY
jgi:hypothetical protein